jgi:deoxycytidylate deaminase
MPYVSSRPYPYLPKGREIKYVSADNPFMMAAIKVRTEQSTDLAIGTGAVVVKDGLIIGGGANQAGLKSKKLLDLHKKYCVRRLLRVPSGKMYWLCPGCAKPKDHAEARAVKDALEKNADIDGADLYLYGHWWCCKPCWDKMTAAGIRDVFLVEGASEIFK